MSILKHISFVFDCLGEKEKGIGRHIKSAALLNLWKTVLGQKVASVSDPLRISDGILFVQAKNSSWANELNYLKRDIISKLNAQAKSKLIKDIRFKVGGFDEEKNDLRSDDVSSDAFENDDIILKIENKIKKKEGEKIARGFTKCTLCGQLHMENNPLCFFCRKIKSDERNSFVCRILNDAPWTDLENIKKYIPNLSSEQYSSIKKRFKMKIRSDLDMLLKTFKFNKRERSLKKMLKDTATKFVFLNSDIMPEQFDVSIIKQTIGEKAYSYLEGSHDGKRSKNQ